LVIASGSINRGQTGHDSPRPKATKRAAKLFNYQRNKVIGQFKKSIFTKTG
jgi:hypothetical protein